MFQSNTTHYAFPWLEIIHNIFRSRKNLIFSEDHEWLKVTGNTARIGISDFAQVGVICPYYTCIAGLTLKIGNTWRHCLRRGAWSWWWIRERRYVNFSLKKFSMPWQISGNRAQSVWCKFSEYCRQIHYFRWNWCDWVGQIGVCNCRTSVWSCDGSKWGSGRRARLGEPCTTCRRFGTFVFLNKVKGKFQKATTWCSGPL